MRGSSLLRTSSFRLALGYAGLFVGAALVLFAVVYWSTARFMERQIEEVVEADLRQLLDLSYRGGAEALSDAIRARLAGELDGDTYLLLQNAAGEIVAGNLSSRAPTLGWLEFEAPASKPNEPPVRVRALGVKLDDESYLLVGLSAVQIDSFRRLTVRAFLGATLATLLISVGAGAVMSGALLRRVEAIVRTSRAIMEGDLSRRLPVHGSGDEFDQLATNLNAMLERNAVLVEEIKQITNDVAHDLRTPLSRLRHRLERVRAGAATIADYQSAIDRSIADTDAIIETFGAILRIAQIEAGAQRNAFKEVDVSELLGTVVEIFEEAARDNGRALTGDIARQLAASGDRQLLGQMFSNVIENALWHTPPGTHVHVWARAEGDWLRIAIADDGPGIPVAERERVFRRFYRLEASRTTPGSGLGLTLVRAIASLHRGSIRLGDNAPGLRVEIDLPRLESRSSRVDDEEGSLKRAHAAEAAAPAQ